MATAEQLTAHDIQRAQAGDHAAFAKIVEQYQLGVYNLAFRLTYDASLAEDLCQDVFLHLYRRLNRYDPSRPFKPWLYKVALNVAINRLKATPVRHATLDETTENGESSTEAVATGYAPVEALQMKETASYVRRSVAELPLEYRAVAVLRYLKELSYDEIAEALDVPLGTVKVRLFRARALLKEKLDRLGFGVFG